MSNVSRAASKNWLSLVLIFLFTFSVSLVGARFVRSILVGKSAAETPETADNTAQQPIANIPPDTIELQPIIDAWAENLDGRVGVAVYDLDRNELAATYNSSNFFPINDLLGLIVAYDGYRQISLGLENADSPIGDTTYGDCLDLIVRASSPSCTESILADAAHSKRIADFLSELGMTQTAPAFSQTTTADDLAIFLKHVWQHDDLNLTSWAQLQDSMLDQPTTADTDWRQGLPSGFSTARVYSKSSNSVNVSDDSTSYGDLALVDFVKQDRHFAIVVLSENMPNINEFSRLATLIEGKVIEE